MGILSGLLGNASTVDSDKLKEEYGHLLIDGEDIEIGFKLIRDVFMLVVG